MRWRNVQQLSDKYWYRRHPLRWALWPFSIIYQWVTVFRRWYLEAYKQQCYPLPIIVVGNISVGGVGKTPLVIALARALTDRGMHVGIVSRGYRSHVRSFPYEVTSACDASLVGDEPLLLAKKTGCPVVIAPRRTDAVDYLLVHYELDIIISDDGLQHRALGRSFEMVVIDALRGFGNEMCLPAGPLREPSERIHHANMLILNGATPEQHQAYQARFGRFCHVSTMTLKPQGFVSVRTGLPVPSSELRNSVAAIAAIGNPKRFFATLRGLGIAFKPYIFPDHYRYTASDLMYSEEKIVMTEKDAVKCIDFATDSMIALTVEAILDDNFWQFFWSKGLKNDK